MILVDIQVPMLERVYDFELDEEMEVGDLMEDILMLITKEEKYTQGKSAGMALYAVRQERMLNRERTLHCQGVRDGDRLILI